MKNGFLKHRKNTLIIIGSIATLLVVYLLSLKPDSKQQTEVIDYKVESTIGNKEEVIDTNIKIVPVIDELMPVANKKTTEQKTVEVDYIETNNVQNDTRNEKDEQISSPLLVNTQRKGYIIPNEHKWSPYIDLDLKAGNKRNLGRLNFFLPVLQDNNSMLFTDYRIGMDDSESKEFNLGLGYRRINGTKTWIFGGYGFFDRRKSEYDNYFSQGVLGVEALTTHWDFRANLYTPLSDEMKKTGNSSGSKVSFVNNTIKITDGESYEKAMGGYDVEIGRSVPGLDNLRLFAAYYDFEAADVESIEGYRIRANYQFNDYVAFELETQEDDVRGNVNYAGLRLTYKFGESKNKHDKLTDLEKRMVTPVVRDVDVVTNEKAKDSGYITAADGSIQKIYFVDNSNSEDGDGSKENPYNNLQNAEAATGEYDIIYVYEGDGTPTNMDEGITLKQGQKLWGNAADLILGYKGKMINVLSKSAIYNGPIIFNGSASADGTIILADNNEIAGLEIHGYNSDIYGKNVTGFNIHNNIISGMIADNGLFIQIDDGGTHTGTIANNSLEFFYYVDVIVEAVGGSTMNFYSNNNNYTYSFTPILFAAEGSSTINAKINNDSFQLTLISTIYSIINDSTLDLTVSNSNMQEVYDYNFYGRFDNSIYSFDINNNTTDNGNFSGISDNSNGLGFTGIITY